MERYTTILIKYAWKGIFDAQKEHGIVGDVITFGWSWKGFFISIATNEISITKYT